MAKKIRLIDEPVVDDVSVTTAAPAAASDVDAKALMKYLEAIDWKLWEMLKLMRTAAEDKS